MKMFRQLGRMQLVVLATSSIFFITWLAMNFHSLTAEQSGFIRFFLTLSFSLSILLRVKPAKLNESKPVIQSSVLYVFLGLTGTLTALCGIIFEVHQFEWL